MEADPQASEMVIPRQLLCCKVCEEEFTNPCYLPCLHTFCQKCIQDHKNKNIDDEGYFPCPTCLTETAANKESIQRNILARRLSVTTNEPVKRETICRFCKNAGNFIEGDTYCKQCDDFLCDSCSALHHQQDEFNGHQTIDVEEYNAQTEHNTNDSSQNLAIPNCCEAYDPLDIGAEFCMDCEISICADCHVSHHGEHRCAELVAVAQHFEKKIKAPLHELHKDTKELTKSLKHLDHQEEKVVAQKKMLKEKVKDRTKFLCGLIQEYETLLLDEIERREVQTLDELKSRRLDKQMHLEAIKGVKDFTSNLITYGSYEEKVLMRRKVGYRIRELCEEPLDSEEVEIKEVILSEPCVTVETICDMFGTLGDAKTKRKMSENDKVDSFQSYNEPINERGRTCSDSMENGDTEPELEEIFRNQPEFHGEQTSGSDTDMLSASNTSENFRNVKFSEEVEEAEYVQENCYDLTDPKREFMLPQAIQREGIKGIGINGGGDIVIGTSTTIHVLEKRGIVRGQIQIENGWNIHSVSTDGKVSLTVPRGDNRFKVRVLKNDGTGHTLADSHVESFGLNFVTADHHGNLVITSNRYASIRKSHGKSAKSGGNIAIYDVNGQLVRRITNDDFSAMGLYLLEKPQCVVCDDKNGNIYVTDPGSHSVIGFDKHGELILEYGNSDTQGAVYQGPDIVSADKYGNLIVTDKREGRIDILSSKGNLKKSFFLDDIPRFVGATPDKLILTAMPDGMVKCYEYL
ncbi:hypothetical protein FSP39_007511 [Pinctada imbricata]|uniref:Tripartite motif-containing protein 2-like n=1 Tax=Pinctada imbricata TaxID=66713 RepID=A0AA88XLH8_PINIB|nr:hypothetical protein FSP39_007511 [Pinctada imbricata]